MDIKDKTVLITGGGSGIGFEIAKLLSEAGNAVIITGRNERKLRDAAAKLSGIDIFPADLKNDTDVSALAAYISQNHPRLDILINNAGEMLTYDLATDPGIYQNANSEMRTNFIATLHLTESLLPLLKTRPEAAIVNVTSILALAPVSAVSTYSASKAALRSFTQSLRHSLSQSTAIKVFELLPPLVNTELSKDFGGQNGIHPQEVATALLDGMTGDRFEIHVGDTQGFYNGFFPAADAAFKMLNNN
ncbi:SDR family oxidoreductase [Mucilaginibacter aquaedulcis]|uniref:SDR family oxidoreductase n=1 Tax=Mucilaginibacter aquaedulcis TaxID=1187081 RepID=UPI0025B4A82A|nr:SDR family NAD(P)-dependent oxidoreductase [Mucilaginibacter aquaedulcis]MDN3548861.1 SDR family NAD(P)-dependent oxidoreductase [Mucilaginibacter aquaedulcis]